MTNIITRLLKLDIRSTLVALWGRFPLSVILVVIVSVLAFYIANGNDTADWTYRSIITGIVVFFLATAVSLLHEQMKMTRIVSISTWLPPLIFGVCFYISVDGIHDGDIEDVTYIILTLSGFFASLFVAPFLPQICARKAENTTHFSNYFTQVSWVLLMSVVVGGALMLMGSIAIGSVIALFDVESWMSDNHIFANWAIIALSLTAPLYGLASFPHARDYETQVFVQNKFFSFIIRYIATPFIFVYFLILYAYSIRVLMNFSDWPRGIVSWMVVGFSSFGYLVYILSRAYADESRMVGVLRRYFPYMVAPQILMLGYAIGLRIAQYDLTMLRYAVVVFGIGLTVVSLYYILSRAKSLWMIPTSLVAAILIVSIGPWSVYSYPLARQEARLIRSLETANILQDGKIVPLQDKKDISRELSNDIASGISYVCDFRECEYIKGLFPAQYEKADSDARKVWEDDTYEKKEPYTKPSKYQIVATITEYIKVERTYEHDNEYNANTEPSFWYDVQYAKYPDGQYPYAQSIYTKLPLDITGYSRIIPVYGVDMGLPASGYAGDRVRMDIAKNQVIYETYSGSITIPFSLSESLLDGSHPRELSLEEATFDVSGSGVTLRVYLQSFSVPNLLYSGSVSASSSVNGFALIRDAK